MRRSTLAPGTPAGLDTSRPRLRARGAPDLLALVPFQLGFHPTESLVTVLVWSGRVALSAPNDGEELDQALCQQPRPATNLPLPT